MCINGRRSSPYSIEYTQLTKCSVIGTELTTTWRHLGLFQKVGKTRYEEVEEDLIDQCYPHSQEERPNRAVFLWWWYVGDRCLRDRVDCISCVTGHSIVLEWEQPLPLYLYGEKAGRYGPGCCLIV